MTESFLERMQRSSHMAGTNVAYIEALYEAYLDDPNKKVFNPLASNDLFSCWLPRISRHCTRGRPASIITEN